MNWVELAVTVGCYIVSGVIYWSNKKKHFFTEQQLKEIQEGLDAVAQGMKSQQKE
jgi:hypothetical protein